MSKNQPDDLEARVSKLEERVTTLESMASRSLQTFEEKELSPAEFVQRLRVETHQDKTLALASFIEQERGRESYLPADIVEIYRECKLRPPGNPHQVFAKLAERGMIMEDGKDGRATLWTLTQTGIDEVQEMAEDDT